MADMKHYTIYRHLDAPEPRYTVREVLITGGQDPVVGEAIAENVGLQAARDAVPRENDTCLFRSPGDAPEIVETWI